MSSWSRQFLVLSLCLTACGGDKHSPAPMGEVPPISAMGEDAGADAATDEETEQDVAFVVAPAGGGWIKAGEAPDDFEMGPEPEVQLEGELVSSISATAEPKGFGTWMSGLNAQRVSSVRGRRVRMRARVKTQDVAKWVGLWMRLDGATDASTGYPELLGFDNMGDRPISGSTDWTEYAIVLDVPEQTRKVMFGILMDGTGKASVGPFTFETVGDDVESTDISGIIP